MLQRLAIILSIATCFAVIGGVGVSARVGLENRPLALYSDARPAMGTTFDIHLYSTDAERAQELFDIAFEEIERIEEALSNYRPTSELSRINARAAIEPVTTDPEVFELLERAFEHSRVSQGAFDITVGKLMKAWGFFRGKGHYPSEAELRSVRDQTGWKLVKRDSATRSISFLHAKLELDLGGIGKGYALDRVAAILKENGVESALLSSGSSSIYALGSPPGKKGWPVRVTEPLDRSRTISTVVLRDESLSTSGSYEKFFVLNGRSYCHIMDPRTGHPVAGVLQSTVIAPTATDSDALSKTTFVLGAQKAVPILKKMPGTAALIVKDKNQAERIAAIAWPAEVVESEDH